MKQTLCRESYPDEAARHLARDLVKFSQQASFQTLAFRATANKHLFHPSGGFVSHSNMCLHLVFAVQQMCMAANKVTYDFADCKQDWLEDGGRRARVGDTLSNAGGLHSRFELVKGLGRGRRDVAMGQQSE